MKSSETSANEILQQEELEALESIYAEDFQKNNLGGLIRIVCNDVDFPIEFYFTFPYDYPSKNVPNFSFPLPLMSKIEIPTLKSKLLELFEVGQPIIFVWIEYMRENMTLYLGDNHRLNTNNNEEMNDNNEEYDIGSVFLSGEPVTDRKSMFF